MDTSPTEPYMHLPSQAEIFRYDKFQHFTYSLGIFLGGALLLPSLAIAGGTTIMIGLGKEIWDHYYGSGFCLYDMFANAIGIGAGWGLYVELARLL